MPDPTIQCLALRSLRDNGSFQPPKHVTPNIAHFEHLMRLTGLREIHWLADTHYDGDQHRALEDVIHWLQEKKLCTFDSIQSLTHIATSIVYNSPAMPKVLWADREHHTHLLWQGYNVKLEHLKEACRVLEDQTVQNWEEHVLLGLKLHVDYGESITEDLTNNTVRYNFLTNHRNKVFHDRNILINAIMASPKLIKIYFKQDSDVTYIPYIPLWRRWLGRYRKFNLDLNVAVEMTAGALTRMTELNAMMCRNTKHQLRNWSQMGRHNAINLNYSKTGSITGQDKLVLHALSAFSSDLMIQNHAIARPMAKLACHIVYPRDAAKMDLYKDGSLLQLAFCRK